MTEQMTWFLQQMYCKEKKKEMGGGTYRLKRLKKAYKTIAKYGTYLHPGLKNIMRRLGIDENSGYLMILGFIIFSVITLYYL